MPRSSLANQLITYISEIAQTYCNLASYDEHIIRCSECGRNLIVKDTINDGVAFLSHLKLDHGIIYTVQRMTQTREAQKSANSKQRLEDLDRR
ncbi:MAG TPA: hypothetical protein VF884_12335 [Nitrososphaeraceae archaeon]